MVQQGEKFGPILCSNSIDNVGKIIKEREKFNYLYKNVIPLPIMSFVDDVNGAARCGTDSLKLNALITAQIQTKRLKFNVGGQGKKANA